MRVVRGKRLFLNVGLLAVLVAVGVGAYLTFSGNGDGAQGQTATVSVTRGTVRATVSASGTVVSPRTLDANFSTGGTVTDVRVKVGDHVTKGEVLARVDPSSAEADLQSAQASLTSAYAGLVSAQASLTSAEASLTELKKGEPTDAQLAQAEAQVVSARSQVDQAEATIVSARSGRDQAQQAVEGAVLTAPMNGTIVSISGAVGETVSSGGVSSSSTSSSNSSTGSSSSSGSSSSITETSAFVVISDLDHLEVQAYFSETDTAQLEVGQRASVTLNALPDEQVSGRVIAIDTTSTTVNQVVDYGATVKLHEQPKGIRAGQTAVVVVVTDRAKDALSVPSAAVQTTGGQNTVIVLRGGKRVSTVVKVGLEGDQTTEIVSGLSEGDEVVIPSTTSSSGFPSGGFPGGVGLGGPGG